MHILSLKPEVILYIYMASCIAVLVFNMLYIATDRFRNKRFKLRGLKLVEVLLEQMNRIGEGKPVEPAFRDSMRRRLSKIQGLRSFEFSMEAAAERAGEETAMELIRRSRVLFLELAEVYSRRDGIEKAYFANIIEKLRIDRGRIGTDAVIEFLKQLVIDRDVYARENALRALQSIGNQEAVIDAWEKMQANEIRHSGKLLADGLLRFSGDKEKLARAMMDRLSHFDVALALPILQFIRLSSGNFCKEILELVESELRDKELRLEGIRYFRRHRYEPARETLLQFLRYQEYLDWEYGAMAALSLSSYPGEETKECLKEGLSASNWYVRLNCAESLVSGLKVPQLCLFDIYNGKDRYAGEILRYVTEKEGIRAQETGDGKCLM